MHNLALLLACFLIGSGLATWIEFALTVMGG